MVLSMENAEMDNTDSELLAEIEKLKLMTVPQLKARHAEVIGNPARTDHPQLLIRQIAYRLQEQVYGGLPEEVRQYAIAIAKTLPARKRLSCKAPADSTERRSTTAKLITSHDSRLPMPGSFLVKEHRGNRIVVRVLDNGFEYDGRKFSSLSAVAQAVTGTKWNGFLFFGLAKEASNARS
jgi:hypothetical protein